MTRLFGTDGVRGVANRDLTPELAFDLGWAAGTLLKTSGQRVSVVVGRDTRLSGSMLENALTAGFCCVGVDVYSAGVLPTPAVAYLARSLDTVAGVVISASHNPAEDNGIKFFNHQGFKLDDALEERIENLMRQGIQHRPRPVGEDVGRVMMLPQAGELYIQHLKDLIPGDFQGLKIVVDCANGAASEIAPRVLRELGAQVISLYDLPDGLNINKQCGSTYPNSLQAAVVEFRAHLGIAYDGDADRLIAVDQQGQVVNGDQLLVCFGLYLHAQGALGGRVVATVMSNLGLREAFSREGIDLLETKVGDRYVLETMVESEAVLGGEQSGHIIFLQHSTTGDGILSSLMLLQVLRDSGRSLRSLAGQMTVFPQVLVNVRVANKLGWQENTKIQQALKDAEKSLQGKGRLLVRASGTEPLIRVMAEGPLQEMLDQITREVAGVIKAELG